MLAHKKNLPSSANLPTRLRRDAVPRFAELPTAPAMAASVVTLQVLLAEYVVDLEAITQVIRADVGLTIELLRSAKVGPSSLGDVHVDLSQIAVETGLERLRKIIMGVPLLGYGPQICLNMEECGSFWLRARQTARTAEQVASEVFPELAETAYLAGLLHHLGELPCLLNWETPGHQCAKTGEIGCRMAQAWGLPELLVDVIRGDEQACSSRESQWLLRLIDAAEPVILRG